MGGWTARSLTGGADEDAPIVDRTGGDRVGVAAGLSSGHMLLLLLLMSPATSIDVIFN